MAQEVFARYEKKYWLNPDQYQVLRGLLLDRMREDDYGRYTICNVYYDTPDYHLIRTSLEKPIYKEKLRLQQLWRSQRAKPGVFGIEKEIPGRRL